MYGGLVEAEVAADLRSAHAILCPEFLFGVQESTHSSFFLPSHYHYSSRFLERLGMGVVGRLAEEQN